MPHSNLIRYCLVLTNILSKPPQNIWSVAVKDFWIIQSTTKRTHRGSPMYVQYFENILASVSSFMNDSRTGHDTGAPSGTHKPALINFLSKRDSELMEKRASFLLLPLLGFISDIFLWLWGYSGPYFDLTRKKNKKNKNKETDRFLKMLLRYLLTRVADGCQSSPMRSWQTRTRPQWWLAPINSVKMMDLNTPCCIVLIPIRLICNPSSLRLHLLFFPFISSFILLALCKYSYSLSLPRVEWDDH